MLKINLEKAYDKIDWDFLDFVMARKGLDSNGVLRCMAASLWFIS